MCAVVQVSFYCFDSALNPRAGILSDVISGIEVVCFRKLSFCSSLEVSQNVGRVKHVVMLKHFVT